MIDSAGSRSKSTLDGFNLREWRTRLGLTQDEAAELLGISKRTFCNYEWGTNARIPYFLRYACRYIEESMNTDPDLRLIASRLRLKKHLSDAKLRQLNQTSANSPEAASA